VNISGGPIGGSCEDVTPTAALLPHRLSTRDSDGVVVLNRTSTDTDCPYDLASAVSQGNASWEAD